MRLEDDSQNTGIDPRICTYEKHTPVGLQYIVSVSTKFATFPSSSKPRELNRVPARREDKRDINVTVEAWLERTLRSGAEEGGTIKVLAKPLMTDVNICDLSRSAFSDF